MSGLEPRIVAERERWATDTSDSAAWDARALVDELRKAAQAARAIDVAEEALTVWPSFEPIKSALAWAIYQRDVKGLDGQSDLEQRRAAKAGVDRIRELTEGDPCGKFSAWPHAAITMASALGKHWPNAALDQLGDIDPAPLSSEASEDYPSLRGRWHLATTKAWEAAEEWQQLAESCERARSDDGLRREDCLWIDVRLARALTHTARADEAVEMLKPLLAQKREWWLEGRLAEALAAAGRTEEALLSARAGLAAPGGQLENRWRLVALVGQILWAKEDALAAPHTQLARRLRQEAGWPADDALEGIAEQEGLPSPTDVSVDLDALSAWWRDAAEAGRVTGVVKAHLPGDGSGFISPDDGGQDIYFSMPRGSAAPMIGQRVSFVVVDGFDAKKNQPSQKAIKVHSIHDQ